MATSYRGTAADVARAVKHVTAALTGHGPDSYGIARGIQFRCANAALSFIQQAFLEKSAGRTGRDGVKWAPLKPETIARRRASPEDVRAGRDALRRLGANAARAIMAGRPVSILRDTSALFRSLSAGVEDQPSNAQGQIVRVPTGRVVVGTNEKPWHQEGVPGKLRARPLWPDVLPPAGMDMVRKALMRGIQQAVKMILERGYRL